MAASSRWLLLNDHGRERRPPSGTRIPDADGIRDRRGPSRPGPGILTEDTGSAGGLSGPTPLESSTDAAAPSVRVGREDLAAGPRSEGPDRRQADAVLEEAD